MNKNTMLKSKKVVKVLTPYQEQYQHFVYDWNKTHSISKAPSYISWKKFYKSE